MEGPHKPSSLLKTVASTWILPNLPDPREWITDYVGACGLHVELQQMMPHGMDGAVAGASRSVLGARCPVPQMRWIR